MTSLRRSLRKKHQSYGVGDHVEILVKKVLHKGLLISKTSDDGDVWNVRLGGDDKERQMNEDLFGRVVQTGLNASTNVKHATKLTQKPRGRPPKNKRGSSAGRKRITTTEGSESNCTNSSISRNNDEKSNSLSKESTKSLKKMKTTGMAKKGTGAGRHKKKIAVAEKSETKGNSSSKKGKQGDTSKSAQELEAENESSSNTRVNTRSSSKKRNVSQITSSLTFTKKTGAKGRQSGRGGKRIRKMKGEEVEKVKYLTGTLYLYRGDNPRVAFVRHY